VVPSLIGYFPKRVTPKPDWIHAPAVLEICSVSGCIAAPPEGWIGKWTHNDLWVYDTLPTAGAVLQAKERDEFVIYAYRLLPVVFREGSDEPFEASGVHPEPIPDTFESLGFDVVSRSVGTNFECSPLSCCNMAQELVANRFCLLPDLETAIDVALRFSVEQPEPGPYFVLEVLREARAL
jgi:hypothetical protein